MMRLAYFLTLTLLFFTSTPFLHSQNLTTEEWKRGDTLVREKKWNEAVVHGKDLVSKYPKNSFGYWLLSQAYGSLAAQDPTQWIPAGEAAVMAGDLENEKSRNYAHAIWCYYNAKAWSRMTLLAKPVLENGRKTTGDDNYALSFLYLTTAFFELQKPLIARKLLGEAHETFKDLPAVLFFEGQLRRALLTERLSEEDENLWQDRLFYVALRYQNDLSKIPETLSVLGEWAMRRAAQAHHQGDFQKVVKELERLAPFESFFKTRDPERADLIAIHKLGAAYRTSHPGRKGKNQRKVALVIIPKSTLSMPEKFGSKNKISVGREIGTDLASPEYQTLRQGLKTFSDSLMALTGGDTEWILTKEIVLTNHRVVRGNWREDPIYKRFILQLSSFEQIEPAVPDSVLAELAEADIIIFYWAGTKQFSDILTTNGGATEVSFQVAGKHLVRMLLIAVKDEVHVRNAPLWFHHEFFHILEWAYPECGFPRGDHPYQKRELWPKNYVGTTQFDYYRETYTKWLLPTDHLRRMEWQNRNQSFWGDYLKKTGSK